MAGRFFVTWESKVEVEVKAKRAYGRPALHTGHVPWPGLRVSPEGALETRGAISRLAIAPTSDPDGRPSPPPELTLGLRAPPTLLSTSSGGKSTITHISSPGNLARLGSVTHVTSFSPASLGSRGGCSIKVSPSSSPRQPPHHRPHMDGFRVLGLTGILSYYTHGKTRPRQRRCPQPTTS